ncbi:flagellar motor protein MotB [Pleurocapsa sp. CCALA 161]|uniref:flagellar motor protein MotB n=1 Tax=Pleurocapsa sp. CCALA 161 TaxID=2107688 RepID=UPI000D07C105|nr:flagellar motor protein MotB [Pleurocapsa sp. CCALA 161]PSB12888.1 flagellar motor protein MotB [Pleurocapsa sp. CCALA 161]
MNEDCHNLSDLSNHKKLNSADLEQIKDLIEILVDEETLPNPDSESLFKPNSNLSRSAQPDLNFLESDCINPKEMETEQKSKSEEAAKLLALTAIEEAQEIEAEKAIPEDLADTVNSLIPLIVGLLEFKQDNSREGIIETVRPVLDRLIAERTLEDSPKMASAIARILPAAIEDEIRLNPLSIARAIAPEIALSIREQILLDADAIPKTLGPEMGKAIKAQIESERDAMVDALYPVIGSTISKYMVEVVQDINSKIERTLSPEGIKRKFRAKVQGISEAELIFQESVGYRVRAIFLIDKDSGLIIQEIQIPGERHLDSEMLAGMLTAIRSFANDCIASGSELDLVDYGDWQILLEVAGYCYLAVIVAGEPPRAFITKTRQVLGEIVIEHDKAIQNFNGNLADVPLGIKTKLERLTQTNQNKPQKSSSPILWLLIFVLGLVFVPWGISSYRARIAHRIEQASVIQLDAAPELSVYRLDPTVKQGKLIVKGRVPDKYLRDRAETILQAIAEQNQLEIDNQIVIINVPVSPNLVTGEIQRLTNLFNQQPQVSIQTSYQPKTLNINGLVRDESTRQSIGQAFKQIPGIEQIVFNISEQLPIVKQRIYFKSGSSELDFVDNFAKINAVKQLLQQHPQLHLQLVASNDTIGSSIINYKLNHKRCQSVKTALIARGILATRLINNCNSIRSANQQDPRRPNWLKRYVGFKPFIPSNYK